MLPRELLDIQAKLHKEVLEKYYGCGAVFPPLWSLEGLSVLDLGCGTGMVTMAYYSFARSGNRAIIFCTRAKAVLLTFTSRPRLFYSFLLGGPHGLCDGC